MNRRWPQKSCGGLESLTSTTPHHTSSSDAAAGTTQDGQSVPPGVQCRPHGWLGPRAGAHLQSRADGARRPKGGLRGGRAAAQDQPDCRHHGGGARGSRHRQEPGRDHSHAGCQPPLVPLGHRGAVRPRGARRRPAARQPRTASLAQHQLCQPDDGLGLQRGHSLRILCAQGGVWQPALLCHVGQVLWLYRAVPHRSEQRAHDGVAGAALHQGDGHVVHRDAQCLELCLFLLGGQLAGDGDVHPGPAAAVRLHADAAEEGAGRRQGSGSGVQEQGQLITGPASVVLSSVPPFIEQVTASWLEREQLAAALLWCCLVVAVVESQASMCAFRTFAQQRRKRA